MLRRILLVLAVALVMAAMMVALAMPTFAAGGAVDNCGEPPGQLTSDLAKIPGASAREARGNIPPGEAVQDVCAPGHREM